MSSAPKYSAVISQGLPDKDMMNMMESIMGKDANWFIYAYYKGDPFPQFTKSTMTAWKDCQRGMAKSLANEVRGGATLGEIATNHLNKVEEMSKMFYRMRAIMDTDAPNCDPNKWFAEKGEALYEDLVGMEITEAQTAWYYGIYVLLKLGKMEDDDKNGYLVTPPVNVAPLASLFR